MEEMPEGRIKFVDCIIMPNKKKPFSKRSYQLKKEFLEKAVISERDFSADLTGSRQAQNFGLNLFFKNFWGKVFNTFGEFKLTAGYVFKLLLASKIGLILVLVTLVVPLTAFEAHIVNVTATIERRPGECGAFSPGYWINHDGCTGQGSGSSDWASQVETLSATFSGVFGSYTGSQICQAVWEGNCPNGNTVAAKLCRAKRQTLANELNAVSNHQDINAILAGADDGSSAFDNLGLTANSTVGQALAAVETVLTNPQATKNQLSGAAYVAGRIYTFYEEENPTRPACVYTVSDSGFSSPLGAEQPLGENSGGGSLLKASVLESFGLGDEADSTSTENSTSSDDIATSTATSTIETTGVATTTTDGTSTDSTSTISEASSTTPVVDSAPTSTEPVSPPADPTPPPADPTPPPADPTPPPADPTPPPADPTPPPVSDPPPAS